LWLAGTLSAGLVALGFFDGAPGPAFFQRAPLDPGELIMIRGGEAFDLRTLGPAGLTAVVAPAQLVARRASALLGLALEELRLECRLPSSAAMLAAVCAPTLRRLAASLAAHRNVVLHPRVRDSFDSAVLDTLIGAITAPRSRVSAPRRRRIARRAEEYLRAHITEPVSLLELCEATGASERTLHLAFLESFGMPPKRLLKILRLNRARQALQRPAPSTTVTVAAMEWGFFHLGRFSVDYREMFGESPVETLRRHARGRGGQARPGLRLRRFDVAA
jgi:AraC family ethanolamine operon transcriptional activator